MQVSIHIFSAGAGNLYQQRTHFYNPCLRICAGDVRVTTSKIIRYLLHWEEDSELILPLLLHNEEREKTSLGTLLSFLAFNV